MEIGRALSTWIVPVRAHGRNNLVPSLHAWWFHTQVPGTTLGTSTLIMSDLSNGSLQTTTAEKTCRRAAGDTMPCCACGKVMVLPHSRCSQPRPVPFFSSFFVLGPPDPAFFNPPPQHDRGVTVARPQVVRHIPGQASNRWHTHHRFWNFAQNVFDRPTETFFLCRDCMHMELCVSAETWQPVKPQSLQKCQHSPFVIPLMSCARRCPLCWPGPLSKFRCARREQELPNAGDPSARKRLVDAPLALTVPCRREDTQPMICARLQI